MVGPGMVYLLLLALQPGSCTSFSLRPDMPKPNIASALSDSEKV